MTGRINMAITGSLGVLLLAGVGLFAAGWFSAGETAPPNFDLHSAPRTLPAIRFQDRDGQSRTLADFKGKTVLLNIWATWCGPCRREMPTLDRLQGTLGGPDFEVVALSIDRGGPAVVRKFFNEIGVQNLALYIDPTSKTWAALKIIGLPVTLLLDRHGREIGRLVGPAEWDTPEMVTFFRNIITKHKTIGTNGAHRPSPGIADRRYLRGENIRSTAALEEHGQ